MLDLVPREEPFYHICKTPFSHPPCSPKLSGVYWPSKLGIIFPCDIQPLHLYYLIPYITLELCVSTLGLKSENYMTISQMSLPQMFSLELTRAPRPHLSIWKPASLSAKFFRAVFHCSADFST